MDRDEIIEMIELARQQRLKKLSMSNRGITSLPPEIHKLSFLHSLDLSYNQISSLPEEFFHLTSLKSIYLNHNELKSIPDDIENLRCLSVLDLSHNKIEDLAQGIGNLVNLTQLDLSYNNLNRLPLEFINLTSLKKLYLESNPFEFPPEKVIKRGLYATMHYLFGEIRKKEKARVMIQVYNMPRDLTQPFSQYLNYFNDLVASYQKHDINFDTKFIKQDFTADMEIDVETESYLIDFLDFLRTNINAIPDKDVSKVLNVQIIELRNQLKEVQKMLDGKVVDIKELQTRIDKLSRLIDTKS